MPNEVKAIMCDIDGTLAHGIMVTRKPYEWHKVDTDTLDETVADLLGALYADGYKIILMSGRDSVCRGRTQDWLHLNSVLYDDLFMRAEGDNREDSVIKRELYDQNVRGKYDVRFVLDDRNRVVDMWRSLGLKCFQVAPGDF